MKVFHGISGAAGQPSSTVAALRRQGVDAVNYITGENRYGFAHDRRIESDGDLTGVLFELLRGELRNFDVFHFYFRPLFYDNLAAAVPTGLDLALLRLFDKRVVLNFRGSEVRLHSEFKKLSPYNYVDEDPDELTSKFPEQVQREYINLAMAVCNHVLVPDPELQSYVPGATIVPRTIDLEEWQPVPPREAGRPLIVHAPSRRIVKSSAEVINAVQELQAEGLAFDFKLVEGMTNEAARQVYRDADIIVDQLRIGWYGVLAVEGMALQKAVVSYVREDLAHHMGPDVPLANANPTNIKAVLRRLIDDVPYRTRVARQGLEYCRRTHDSERVAKQLIGIYQSPGASVEQAQLVDFFAQQYARHADLLKEFASSKRSQEREIKILRRKLEVTSGELEALRRKLAPLIWIKRKLRL